MSLSCTAIGFVVFRKFQERLFYNKCKVIYHSNHPTTAQHARSMSTLAQLQRATQFQKRLGVGGATKLTTRFTTKSGKSSFN